MYCPEILKQYVLIGNLELRMHRERVMVYLGKFQAILKV